GLAWTNTQFSFSFSGIGSYIKRPGSGITYQSNLFCLFIGTSSCLYIFILYSHKLSFCSCCQAPYLCGSHKCFNPICCDVHEYSEYYKDFNPWTIGNGLTSLVCTSILVSLISTILDTSWYGIIWTTRSNQIIEQDLIGNSQQIGIHLATDFFLPFEFISIILLIALIGAIDVTLQ
ncbi:hypothetical protein ES332_D01G128000v1, partial [Gossypium tomentosum]